MDCSEPVDIFFALDASDSLAPEEFNLEKDLVIQLLQRLIDANRDAKAGFLTFTTEINNVQDLQTNLAFTQFALRNVVFDREGTSLLAPLTFVFDNIFTSTNSNLRENSRKLFFLITDGEDQINTLMQLTDISRKLEERNVTIITMGIGTLLNTVQLSEIASMPHEQNLLIFSDLNEALGNVSSIIDRTCKFIRCCLIIRILMSILLCRYDTCGQSRKYYVSLQHKYDNNMDLIHIRSCIFIQNMLYSGNERV